MDSYPFNILDTLFVFVILLSLVVGIVRGFVREILALAAWVGAGWTALTFFPQSSAYMREVIDNPLLADGVAGAGVFIITLVVLTIIARILAKIVQGNKMVGPLDRMLGLFFGVTRGAVLVCLGYIFTVLMMSEPEEPPEWVSESKLLPYVETGSKVLQEIIPADLDLPIVRRNTKSGADRSDEFGYTPDDSIGRLIEQQLQEGLTETE